MTISHIQIFTMNIKFSLLTFFLVLFVAIEQNAVEGGSCEEFVFGMMVQQTKLVVPCIKKLGYKDGKERKEKLNCVLKCMFIDSGFIEKDGTADIDKAQKLFETQVPADLRERASAALSECGVHAAGLDPSEGDCASYGPLADCLMEFSQKMCL